jgi:hypothetical protein
MDAFEASDQEFLEEARGDLPMVRIASWVMFFLGGIYGIMGLAFGAIYGTAPLWGGGMNGEEQVIFVVLGVFFGLFMIGLFAAPMILAGYGLRQGKMWAWVITVCVGGLFLTSACMPFGAFLLYAMLNEVTREAFLTKKS